MIFRPKRGKINMQPTYFGKSFLMTVIGQSGTSQVGCTNGGHLSLLEE